MDYRETSRTPRALLDAAGDERSARWRRSCFEHPEDDRLKLFATTTMLRARRAAHDVFRCGRYEPLAVEGPARQTTCSRSRVCLASGRRWSCVPRLVATLKPDGDAAVGEVWGDTRIVGSRAKRRAAIGKSFTGACAAVIEQDGRNVDSRGRRVRAIPDRVSGGGVAVGMDHHRPRIHHLVRRSCCSSRRASTTRCRTPLRPDSDEFLHVIQSTCQAAIHSHNKVEIFTNGAQFYPAMRDAILAAESS